MVYGLTISSSGLPVELGWALSGSASSWEYRAAQSRLAGPKEAQEASWGTAKGEGCPCCAACPWNLTETNASVAPG
eukprot:scaffold101755_cov45-Phaeocystis_antarctica.AAC.2